MTTSQPPMLRRWCMRTRKATIRRIHTAPIVGFLTNVRKAKTPRQQITAATVGQKWTKTKLKILNAAHVGTGITVQKSKKAKRANGLYAAICATELYGATPLEKPQTLGTGGLIQMKVTLKRCRCGLGLAPIVDQNNDGEWVIRCFDIIGCGRTVWGNTVEEVVDAWNDPQNCGIETDGGDTDV